MRSQFIRTTNSYSFSVSILLILISREKNGKTRRKHLQSFFYKSGRVKYSQLRNEKHVTKTSSAIQWHFVEREVNKIQKNLALIRITLDHWPKSCPFSYFAMFQSPINFMQQSFPSTPINFIVRISVSSPIHRWFIQSAINSGQRFM